MVDEHYYQVPDWFLNNLNRYDSYDRKKSKVYLGEYASWGNSLSNALAEAAYMTAMERNGDVLHLASYAPLMANTRHVNWSPNLIYFDNTAVAPSVNYYVQQLYCHNSGDTYLPNTVAFTPPKASLPVSVFLGTWNTQAQFEQVRLKSGAGSESSNAPDRTGAGQSSNSGAWVEKDDTYTQSGNEQPALYKVTGTQVVAQNGKPTYTYSVRARKTGGKEGFLIGFGATDAANYLWWNLGGWGNTQHGIERFVNSSSHLVGKAVPGSIETGRWYDIKIEVNGQGIRCFLDGKLIHDVVDDSKPTPQAFVSSCVRDSKSGELILKLVNVSPFMVQSRINLAGLDALKPTAIQTVLSGDPRGNNSFENPRNIIPRTEEILVQKSFDYVAPPHSVTVIRMKTRG
jgi:alpha-L-arabinofuranosidase